MTLFGRILIAALLTVKTAYAAETNEPLDFSADELTYDRELNLIIARGNVFFKQDKSSLRADHINYDTVDGVVIATGNVEIYTPDGGIMQGNYAKLSGDLKDGLIKKIQYVLADKSVMTAQKAEHIQGNYTEFEDVAYSSCDFCEDGSRFWELKAKKMIHDREKQNIYAYNATMAIEDVPVMYLPYFYYPDPSVKRRSGFLFPGVKSNRALGMGIIIPYYLEISPYTDFLFSPRFASKGILWGGILRHNFSQGKMDLDGTYIEQDGEKRYSIRGKAEWHISDVWRAHINVDKTSDATYLRRYDVNTDEDTAPWLKSDAAVEALTHNTYFKFGGNHYQNMRAYINDKTIPEAVPLAELSYTTEPGIHGNYWTFDISTASLKRKTGTDSTRLSLEADWDLPGVTDWGMLYNFKASTLLNGYKIKDYQTTRMQTYSGDVTSFNPQASLTVSYPFVRIGEKFDQTLEPVIMGIVAPNKKNSDKIPNEDSADLDLNDTNLFAEKRYIGYDRFEPGSRINYGLKWNLYDDQKTYVSALIGQSYRFSNADIYTIDSGMVEPASDIVGNLSLNPAGFFSLSYSFRMNRTTLNLNRSDLSLSIGNALLRGNVSYINLKNAAAQSTYTSREELDYSLTSFLTRYWKIGYHQKINLSNNGGVLETGGFLRYEDECFALNISLDKEYTSDRDYKNGLTFGLNVEFKPFGQFRM
ncbi:MAG: LPS-assembly protein LptD [Alphaproteobacteria bacterium]|nr:LPS-assembly protein LptD [Alphaproteobacteria bacterium]